VRPEQPTQPRSDRPRAFGLEGASDERRRRLTRRLVPALIALAIVSILLALIVGSGESTQERVARNYAAAWKRADYGAMWRMLTPDAQRRISSASLASAYRSAAATATSTSIEPGKAMKAGGGARVPVRVTTRIFGTVGGFVVIPVTDDGRVDWRPELVFPGLRAGERLTRNTTAPRRARILDRRGHRIVSGPAKARTPGGGAASTISGSMGVPKDPAETAAMYARGFPAGTPVGTSGLERALEQQVEGRPGGELLVGTRRLAASTPQPAHAVRSTIDLGLQAAASTALAGRFGGIAAVDPRSGKIRALAGIAFSAPQPPGSTFKMITLTAALENHVAKPSTEFPVETHAVIDGVDLDNASKESCGGSLVHSFAESCNSVFAPLGVKLGGKRLVDMAERFGFNDPPRIPGAAPSTIPSAEQIGSDLAVGSSAIGQGKVLATPLQMALIAGTFAARGVRHEPTLLEDGPPGAAHRVTSRRVARTVEKMMIEVVRSGTGTSASLAPGVTVAGKTGTAELGSTVGPTGESTSSETDAWFAGYAPVGHPKLAAGALFVKAGAGGDVAAPAVRTVLAAAVGR
jgi:penicillin-binding protein A